MQTLDITDTLSILAISLKKPVMWVSLSYVPDDWNGDGTIGAIPYLTAFDNDHAQFLANGCGYIVFDTYEEMQKAYNQTVGDDGPTETNPYDGPARAYALTCTAEGVIENENT